MSSSSSTTHTIEKINLKSIDNDMIYDLREVFEEFSLFHDIDNIATSGSITIKEQGNLIAKCPIVGREYIEIKFASQFPDDKGEIKEDNIYHRVFFVYSADAIIEYADTRQYTLRFTDIMGLLNNDIRISAKYSGYIEGIISEIVTNVINSKDKYKKIITDVFPQSNVMDFENEVKTKYERDIVVPNWKPFKLFSYLTSKGVSDSGMSNNKEFSDCLFFQRANGKYVFTSYEHMFANPKTPIELKRQPSQVAKAVSKYSIINYTFTDLFNVQMEKSSAMLGHRLYTVDMHAKQYKDSDLPYESIFNAVKEYNEKTGVKSKKNKYEALEMSTIPVESIKLFNINENSVDLQRDKTVYPVDVKGMSINVHMKYLRLNVELNGSSDLDIGMPVMINIGKHDSGSIAEYLNTKWVVTKMRHSVTLNEFSTYLELCTPVLNKIEG